MEKADYEEVKPLISLFLNMAKSLPKDLQIDFFGERFLENPNLTRAEYLDKTFILFEGIMKNTYNSVNDRLDVLKALKQRNSRLIGKHEKAIKTIIQQNIEEHKQNLAENQNPNPIRKIGDTRFTSLEKGKGIKIDLRNYEELKKYTMMCWLFNFIFYKEFLSILEKHIEKAMHENTKDSVMINNIMKDLNEFDKEYLIV